MSLQAFAAKSPRYLLLCAFAVSCYAQQSSANPPAPLGVENAWDVRTILANLSKDSDELKPLLEGLKPQQWYEAKGAPTTYILQWQTAERQLNDVTTVTKALALKTDSLSLALDDYFRFEALDVTIRSLEEGVRKYDDRPVADRFTQLIARNFNNRERFRDYIRELALSTEQNFKIADGEAQRCRGIISKEPAPTSRRSRK